MSAASIIKIILTFGPELINLIKWIYEQIDSGIDEHQVKEKIKGISGAMSDSDRANAARRLNNIFKGRGNE